MSRIAFTLITLLGGIIFGWGFYFLIFSDDPVLRISSFITLVFGLIVFGTGAVGLTDPEI